MDAKTAAKAVKQGEAASVYLLYGSEKYQMNEFAALLEEQLIPKEERDFAIVRLDLADTSIQSVVEEAETVPFMVPKKLIFVRDTSFFTAAKDNGKVEHRPEALLDYMNNPADYSIIVFMVQQDKLDERKKVVKAVKKGGVALSFAPLGGEELLGWVDKQARQQGCTLADGAADVLVRNAGTNLQSLSAEVEKLCLYAGEGGVIDVDTVNMLVARSTEQNVFALVEDIANLRLDKALAIFYELLKQREEPIKIAALITRQFRIILQVKTLSSQGYTQQQIASQIGLHPYAVKIAGEQARKFETVRLERILNRLAQLDYEMKTGAVDKVLGLELFLLRLGA
ncbi:MULTISPECIES: DNA polymerase III subunit delta [Paenibacillus]|uniref:DNA polymerase III subunit delta n=1 Tax=Paenibacillus campinasensis TaxID=66347 RepID=A0A268F4J6_9BACL|nr:MULTISPECIES: DNA polymerase III subunit delta [Paenibacillus]MUG64561.1 DNA polymerase III subunit delta [Paenibacillus campinasensis]PAD80290.1 DNA polymerase III subunit delta [Paenibacillus campinasensis]PAK55273.1 DNA polymerase III subunit delta [Paenibacillus sp. 7541]